MTLALVGDVGGTNARFALVETVAAQTNFLAETRYTCSEFRSIADAIREFLSGANASALPSEAVIAVAGPIINGTVKFTNNSWAFSEQGVATECAFSRVQLLNDFEAIALGVPHLKPSDYREVGNVVLETKKPSRAISLVAGPGTGFGASATVEANGTVLPLATESGHISFAPADELEQEILSILRGRFGRVSVERILSGPGLRNLYEAMANLHDWDLKALRASEITAGALEGDTNCTRAVEQFCAILGGVAGDLALTLGVNRAVYIAGGIVPRFVDLLSESRFRACFEDKGRFRPHLSNLPTRVIAAPFPALIGATTLVSKFQQF